MAETGAYIAIRKLWRVRASINKLCSECRKIVLEALNDAESTQKKYLSIMEVEKYE